MMGASRLSGGDSSQVLFALRYNVGRILSYGLLGIIFSILSLGLSLVGVQRFLGIIAGIVLITLVFFSMDVEKALFKDRYVRKYYERYFNFLNSKIRVLAVSRPGSLGFLNGLLPCGVVYLAILGSLTSGSPIASIMFMMFFGLGTAPMLVSLMIGANWIYKLKGLSVRRVVPYVQLLMGVYLIYRGVMTAFPENLDFFLAIRDGIMCH